MKKFLCLIIILTLSSCSIFQRTNCHSYPQSSLRYKMKSPNLKKSKKSHHFLPQYKRNRD